MVNTSCTVPSRLREAVWWYANVYHKPSCLYVNRSCTIVHRHSQRHETLTKSLIKKTPFIFPFFPHLDLPSKGPRAVILAYIFVHWRALRPPFFSQLTFKMYFYPFFIHLMFLIKPPPSFKPSDPPSTPRTYKPSDPPSTPRTYTLSHRPRG